MFVTENSHNNSNTIIYLTLSISATECGLYNVKTGKSFLQFQLSDIEGVEQQSKYLLLSIGSKMKKINLNCGTLEKSTTIVTCLLEHCHALLRHGRGHDENPEMSFWRYELMYPDLPPPPLLPGLDESRLWDAAMPALADLILTTANQNSIVLAELLSDIETICYRHNFSKGDHTNGEKIALSEFLKVLNHLKCIPLGIRFDRLLQLLDPDNIDAINYQEFVELLRKEINR